jgi:signal transduction histidine kinase
MNNNPSDPSHPNPPSWPEHFSRRSAWQEWRKRYGRGQRPPWWPENEDWPPKRWGHMRRSPFLRRMGCFFFGFVGFVFLAFMGLLGILRFILAPLISFPGQSPLNKPDLIVPFGLVGFILLFFTLGWGIRSWRHMSRPLDDLIDASSRVAEGDYSVRVEEKGPPEIYTLVRGFNAMAERLQVSDQQRRNMLADVSHELRNPITVMQGNLEGMIDGVYPADETHLKSLMEETQILARLVDDLRTLSLAEAGSLQLKREAVDVAALVRETVSAFRPQADVAGVKIELSLSETPSIEIDPNRIREVLFNLLANALRYTPREGMVKVDLAEAGLGAERSVLVFVHDSGPGIASEDLNHIFDRFYKSSDSGGMGLGLSIAKYLVELHGGRIWAESEAGKGAMISFTLPL